MTLNEVKRSLACPMRIDGELAQVLDAAGVGYPFYLGTDAMVDALRAAIDTAQSAPAPTKPKKDDKAAP